MLFRKHPEKDRNQQQKHIDCDQRQHHEREHKHEHEHEREHKHARQHHNSSQDLTTCASLRRTSVHGHATQLRAGGIAQPTAVDEMHRRVMGITGADPLPYGIAPNRQMLDMALASAVEQGIIDRAPSLAELFAPSTHALVA